MAEETCYDPYFARRARLSQARRRRIDAIATPGLPVDGDPVEVGGRAVRAGSLLDAVLSDLTADRDPFFQALKEKWRALFPDLPAAPLRFGDGLLVLGVPNAATLFLLRPKLPAVKRKIRSLPGAPKAAFKIHMEIRNARTK